MMFSFLTPSSILDHHFSGDSEVSVQARRFFPFAVISDLHLEVTVGPGQVFNLAGRSISPSSTPSNVIPDLETSVRVRLSILALTSSQSHVSIVSDLRLQALMCSVAATFVLHCLTLSSGMIDDHDGLGNTGRRTIVISGFIPSQKPYTVPEAIKFSGSRTCLDMMLNPLEDDSSRPKNNLKLFPARLAGDLFILSLSSPTTLVVFSNLNIATIRQIGQTSLLFGEEQSPPSARRRPESGEMFVGPYKAAAEKNTLLLMYPLNLISNMGLKTFWKMLASPCSFSFGQYVRSNLCGFYKAFRLM